jgi:hypothetical protein
MKVLSYVKFAEQFADKKRSVPAQLLAGVFPVKDVAKNIGVSVPTLYQWLLASS